MEIRGKNRCIMIRQLDRKRKNSRILFIIFNVVPSSRTRALTRRVRDKSWSMYFGGNRRRLLMISLFLFSHSLRKSLAFSAFQNSRRNIGVRKIAILTKSSVIYRICIVYVCRRVCVAVNGRSGLTSDMATRQVRMLSDRLPLVDPFTLELFLN